MATREATILGVVFAGLVAAMVIGIIITTVTVL